MHISEIVLTYWELLPGSESILSAGMASRATRADAESRLVTGDADASSCRVAMAMKAKNVGRRMLETEDREILCL